MIWGAMRSVGPLCFLKSTVNAAFYQRFWSTFCFHLLTSFMKMLISFSSRTLVPAHSAKTTSKWFADHDITVLDWPANSPDLNPIENIWGIVKRKIRNKWPKNADELKATVKEVIVLYPNILFPDQFSLSAYESLDKRIFSYFSRNISVCIRCDIWISDKSSTKPSQLTINCFHKNLKRH